MSVLTRDPVVTDATLVALAATGSPCASFAVAADVRRFAGWAYYRVSTLRCEVPGGAEEHSLARGSGLVPEQIHGRAPAAVALAYLDAHLARPPYLIVAHQAGALSLLIRRNGQDCPALTRATLVDTAELAQYLRGTPTTAPLESYAEEFEIPRSSLTTTTDRAALTARLFARLTCDERPDSVDLGTLLARCPPSPRHELTARTP